MATSSSQKLSKSSQANVIAYLQHVFKKYDISKARQRFEAVDKAIQLESNNRRAKVKSYYDDIEQPIIEGPVKTVSNFLIDTFITSPSIFEVVTDKQELAPIARQMNIINMENSQTTAWARELILYFNDLPKYNMGGIEVYWRAQSTLEAVNNIDVNISTGAAIETVQREGNELKRMDIYNTFFDTTVDINKVHVEGEFSGYIERVSMVKLLQYMENLKIVAGAHVMNEDAVWAKGNTATSHWYSPAVNTEQEIDNTNDGYLGFFGITPEMKGNQKSMNYTYELTTLYCRIIPSMFGIKVPGANSLQIWKFVVVNWDTVIYAEKQTNIHNYMPIVLTQIDEQGIKSQVKSMAEKLIPIQNLSTKYYDLRVASLVRSISDRLLYDKSRIRKDDIDNDNPKAKVPVKPDLLKGGIANAVHRIEYSDTMGQTFLQELNWLENRANKQSGLNNPQQGQLQRGNRTLGEFNEVMQNADADLRTWGKLTEVQAMVPIKAMIRANIFQYQLASTLSDPTNGETVTIAPADIRKSMLNFKVADGLVTRDMILDLPTARTAMELILQVPMLQSTYGAALPGLVERIFGSIGFNLSDLRMQAQAQAGVAPAQAPVPAAQGGTTNGAA